MTERKKGYVILLKNMKASSLVINFMIFTSKYILKLSPGWPYLWIGATKHLNKDTFLSQTFKVQEGKVVLFFVIFGP